MNILSEIIFTILHPIRAKRIRDISRAFSSDYLKNRDAYWTRTGTVDPDYTPDSKTV